MLEPKTNYLYRSFWILIGVKGRRKNDCFTPGEFVSINQQTPSRDGDLLPEFSFLFRNHPRGITP
ncbi:MAG: hypothetical protein COB98_04180 [Flavobacteriaceae bacterium]|nr:MAG: hypothetical protein COB98_04180 [Flavobacteriaceae bacterium]